MSDLENLGIEVNEEVINYGEGNLGLADFMEVDVSDIEANDGGFSLLPAGVYKFSCEAINVTSVNRKLKDTNEEVKIPQVSFKCKVEEVVDLAPAEDGSEIDPEKLIGRYYFHNVALPSYDAESYTRAMGRVKSLAQHIAPEESCATFKQMLAAIANKSFTGKIRHRKYATKDDADGEKSGRAEDLDLKTVKPA